MALPDIAPLGARFNFAQHLIERNVARGAKAAYLDDAGVLSYGELAERIRRLAAALLAAGIRREERVLLLMQDCSDWPVAFLGAMYAGIVPVAVNTLLTADDCAYFVAHSRAQAALVSGALLPTLQAALAQAPHEVRQIVVARSGYGDDRPKRHSVRAGSATPRVPHFVAEFPP
jgi:benzoate-CoA ligase